eukprot:1037206-Pyramimonas_sp.AAC.1
MALWGPLAGSRQTVVRGELTALLLALQVTFYDVIFITGCEGVYLNFHNGHPSQPEGPDADLWHQ